MALPYSIDFLKSMAEGVFVVNRDRQIILWNAQAEKLTGIKQQQMLGKSCAKHLRCHVDEAGKALCDTACPLRKALQFEKPLEAELHMKHSGGDVIPVKVKVIPYHNSQGFVEGAIEIFAPIATPNWLYSYEAMEDRITFTDSETGLYNRNFLDSYYLRLVKEQRGHYDRGIVVIDLEVLGEMRNLKAKMDAHELQQQVVSLLRDTISTDGEMVAARWSKQSYVLLINNSHPVHLQGIVMQLEDQLRDRLFHEKRATFDIAFRLMHTLIASDEPLEKVVDILHAKGKRLYIGKSAVGQ